MTQPTQDQIDEIRFKIDVEPVVHAMLDDTEKNSGQLGLPSELFQRAVFVWAMERLALLNTPPEWFMREMDRIQGGSG